MPVDSLLALIAFIALVLAWVALPGTARSAEDAAPVPAGVLPA
jgi:hypothetical protein